MTLLENRLTTAAHHVVFFFKDFLNVFLFFFTSSSAVAPVPYHKVQTHDSKQYVLGDHNVVSLS